MKTAKGFPRLPRHRFCCTAHIHVSTPARAGVLKYPRSHTRDTILRAGQRHKPWYADHTASIAVRTYLYHAATILCIECAPAVMAALQEHGLIPTTRTVLAEVMEKAKPQAEHMPVIE